MSSLDSLCIHVSVLGVYDECVMLARESCVCVVSEVYKPDDMCGWSFLSQWTPCEYVPVFGVLCIYVMLARDSGLVYHYMQCASFGGLQA